MKLQTSIRILSLLCALLMTLSLMAACGDKNEIEEESTNSQETTQAVTEADKGYGLLLTDGLGNPITDVIVKVMNGDETVKMYPYKGEYLSMDLPEGTYTLELDLSMLQGNYTYDPAACVLTPENKSLSIRLLQSTTTYEGGVFVGYPISADYPAQIIKDGSYRVSLTPNDYNFFVFMPDVAATYTITCDSASEIAVSYHGSTFFVQGADLTGDSEDIVRYENGISITVYPSNLGADFVFALRPTSAESCIVNIKNVGDPGTRIEDMPWQPYLEDTAKVAEQLQLSANATGTYTKVNLSDLTLTAVYNETDGYYHLGSANGPLLYIDLTANTEFISSVRTICANQRMGLYIYDANGKITEKRSYNELFHQYGMPADSDTVLDKDIRVPLTAKLAEAIQTFGEKNGWWANGESNIFTSTLIGPYNQAYAWLLFCGYYA